MPKVSVYNMKGEAVGELELNPEVFETPYHQAVLHQVVLAQQANARRGTHKTKTRGEVRGGGKKPWRQKGTGRARAGTIRSPLWRGGAVLFGPQPRSYAFKVNKKIRSLALRMALTSRLSGDNLMVVNSIDLPEVKTKGFVQVAKSLGLEKALIVSKDPANTLVLSARNIPGIKVLEADKLNVYDVLYYPKLVLLESAAREVQERLK